MNSSALGDEGVVAVRSFFNRMGFIKPYINSDDTQPIWDGNLFVYNHRDVFTNDRLIFQVSAQVKAHEFSDDDFPDHTYYDIELVNLENYRIDGGVVFFNVLVGADRNQIYVNFLSKANIQNLIDTAKGKKTRSVKFSKIPKTYTEIIGKLRTLHLQRTHTLIPFEQVKKYKNVKWAIDSYGLSDSANPLEYITTNPVNILAYVDGMSAPLYVGNGTARITSITLPENLEVRIGEETFYSEYKRIVEGNTHTYLIGRSLTLKFVRLDQQVDISVLVNLKGDTIEELIHEITFVLKIFEKKHLLFGDNKLDMPITVKQSEIKEWKGKLRFWNDVKALFSMLHIEEPIHNIQELTDTEINKIKTLIAGILYNKTVIGKNGMKADHLEWISFSNIRVLVLARYISDDRYRLINIFDSVSAFYTDDKGKSQSASIYSKIIAEDILASNIDWSNLLKSYQDVISVNPDYYERVNWDVLRLIKLFDMNSRMSILLAAEELLHWLMSNDSLTSWRDVLQYNLLQIRIRKGLNITSDERNWLFDQEEYLSTSPAAIEETQKNQMLFAVQVLLSNQYKARRQFERMSEKEQKLISDLPIYNLYQKLLDSNDGCPS